MPLTQAELDDVTTAVEAYAEVLAINPDHSGAIEALEVEQK